MTTVPRAPRRARTLLSLVAVGAAAGALVLVQCGPATAATIPATCSNSSTDAATIQSAINGSAAGDEIVIDGPCQITSTVSLRGGRAYRGDSPGTTLTAASGHNLPAVLASDSWVTNSATTGDPLTLRDLTIDANRAGNPTGGDAVVIRSWNTTVEGLHIRNARSHGLRVTNRSRNGTTLTNTQVNGTIRNLFVADSGQRGIYVEDFASRGIAVSVQGDAASTLTGNRVFQFNGSGTTYLAITQVNYGAGQVAVTGNVVRGNGSGTGLSYQRGANQLTVASTGNSVTGVTTARSVGAGVTLTAGL